MKSGIRLDTIVKDWFLVDFTHLGEPMDKRILRELETQFFQTENSVYRSEEDRQRISLPV